MPAPDIDLATYYELVFRPRGFGLAAHHYPICVGLEDTRIRNFLSVLPQGAGKSTLFNTAFTTLTLGRDPTMTILNVSAGEKLPQTFMRASMEVIQADPHYQRLFPGTRPDIAAGWSTERGLFVTGRPVGDENPSYFCAGLKSKALTGIHARMLVFDDIHDEENSRTPESREEIRDIYYRTLVGRADGRGARKIAVGRRWAEDDLYGEWMKSGEWVVMFSPAERPGENTCWYDVYVPDGLECVYSETLRLAPVQDPRMPYKRYLYPYAMDAQSQGFYWPDNDAKRADYNSIKRGSPRIAAINYNGDLSGAEDAVFTKEDFQPYAPPQDLSLGIQAPTVARFIRESRGRTMQAWDTAMGQSRSESMTVALTGLFVPCRSWHRGETDDVAGRCPFHYDVMLLDRLSKSIDFRRLTQELVTLNNRWAPREVGIEEKQSGISLLQAAKGSNIPIRPTRVVEGKIERAVNGIGGGPASVQGWARMGRVQYPAGAAWWDDFESAVLAFSGDASKRSDDFDALVHLVTRAIELSSLNVKLPDGTATSDFRAADQMALSDPSQERRHNLTTLAELGASTAPRIGASDPGNPFNGMCGSPCYAYGIRENHEWCFAHRRKTGALSGCNDWFQRGSAPADKTEALVIDA